MLIHSSLPNIQKMSDLVFGFVVGFFVFFFNEDDNKVGMFFQEVIV